MFLHLNHLHLVLLLSYTSYFCGSIHLRKAEARVACGGPGHDRIPYYKRTHGHYKV